jgi:hypothetical protein
LEDFVHEIVSDLVNRVHRACRILCGRLDFIWVVALA